MSTLRFPEGHDRVLLDVEDHIARVRLNRPDKRNGLDVHMFEGLVAVGEHLIGRNDVRAVVLSGEGAAFCAGLDFKSFMAGGPSVRDRLLARGPESPANVAQRVAWVFQEAPMPVIAAVHGACIGGGLQIALGADLRIIAPDTMMSVMEITWGLIPDMSITQTLSRCVRLDVAKELTFTGRKVGAEEAAALGLATRIAEDPLAAAMELARTIAARSPEAVRAAKRLWQQAPALDPAGAFALETELQLPLLGSKNQMEAVMAKMQKRAPAFKDPTD